VELGVAQLQGLEAGDVSLLAQVLIPLLGTIPGLAMEHGCSLGDLL